MNNTINIAGRTISYNGGDIIVGNNKIIINGVDYSNDESIINQKVINIVVNGNVTRLDVVSGNVEVKEYVGSLTTISGDVECGGDINGNVKTTSGDVRCEGTIKGSVNTVSGDIKSRK